ncbi:MAG: FAD:protein FMN transferase [Vicinamibacterales bacterium]
MAGLAGTPAGARVASALLLVAAVTGSCATDSAAPRLVERAFVSMGSSLRVAIWTNDEASASAAAAQVFNEFERLESRLSIWKDGSDVVRLNAAAGRVPVAISRETIDVLAAARMASEMTDGKFDITFGALSDIWKFDHDQDNVIPDRASIEKRLPFVDYRAVQVNAAKATAFIARPGVRIHLGGIGKGYAVDRAVRMLTDRGFADFLIQAGGDTYAAGTNNGPPWTLGIADPRGTHDAFAAVQVRDATLSTSGDYERAFVKDGVRYHHLIDPDRGAPARGCRSVTIVARSATTADVLSTGVFIMGPEAGMALIEKLPDIEGVIVTASNEVLVSSGLKGRVEIKGPPTDAP